MVPLGVSFSLQIEDQSLVDFDCLPSWTHLILMGLCHAFGLCHSFKSCALPPCILLHTLSVSPFQVHNVASKIFWWDNQKIALSWREKYCIISNSSIYSGLYLPCFLQHMQQQHLSVNPLGQVTGTWCLLRSETVGGIPFEGSWASSDNVCSFWS